MTAVAALRLTLKIRRDTALREFPRRSTDSNTNLLGIDTLSMQVLHFLSDKTEEEKAAALALLKTAFKLQNLKKS